jgi:hypothetical protein
LDGFRTKLQQFFDDGRFYKAIANLPSEIF